MARLPPWSMGWPMANFSYAAHIGRETTRMSSISLGTKEIKAMINSKGLSKFGEEVPVPII
jgi:hypothetical protein